MTYAAGALAALGLMALAAPSAWAQASQTATANALSSATVIAGITLTKTANLTFGSFSVGTGGGTVVVHSDGSAPTETGTVVRVPAANAVTAASFDVAGEPGETFTITLPTTVDLTGPGPAMPLTLFEDSKGGTSALPKSNVVLTAGAATFTVGATLTAADSTAQTAGLYTGDFDVTVTYD